MKDYSIAVEAIKTAEFAVEKVVDNNSTEVNNKGKDIFCAIAEYLMDVLSNADFPKIEISSARMWGREGDNLPLGEVRLDVGYHRFIHDNEYFNAQLFIRGKDIVSRIFINEYGYVFSDMNNNLLPITCYLWKDLKSKIDPAIDAYFKKRNSQLREKLNNSQAIVNIVNNFEL